MYASFSQFSSLHVVLAVVHRVTCTCLVAGVCFHQLLRQEECGESHHSTQWLRLPLPHSQGGVGQVRGGRRHSHLNHHIMCVWPNITINEIVLTQHFSIAHTRMHAYTLHSLTSVYIHTYYKPNQHFCHLTSQASREMKKIEFYLHFQHSHAHRECSHSMHIPHTNCSSI